MEAAYDLYTIKTQCMLFRNYAYLWIDNASRKAFVVDPSWDITQITDILRQRDAELSAVLLTHSHFDHTNMVNKLSSLYQPVVYMSRPEADYYRFRCDRLAVLEDMERVRVGDTEVLCLLTPGHTKGGACYWAKDHLFSGDTLFIEGCGLCDGPGGSAEDMYDSLRRLMGLLPPNVRVYPGHSYGDPPGQEMSRLYQRNIYLQIDDIQQFVKYRNRKSTSKMFHFK